MAADSGSFERLPPPFPEAEEEPGGREDSDAEGEDIFTGRSKPTQLNTKCPSAISKENGLRLKDEEQDLFAESTVELSVDHTQNNQKKESANVSKPTPFLVAPISSSSKSQQKSYEDLEEEEQEDQFEMTVKVTDPEKIGEGMNAYVAYQVSTQTSLPVFRSKQLSVKRRFSDFLGLYEKLSEKHSLNGYIVPPPPEKSLIGMTKVKVGKEDSSSAEFLEKRRAALERYLQRVVKHPTLLQDPDVREFLEKEELPRAVGTQTLSGAGLLKMFSKATDAVSKMTIKMNESDIWFEEKLQEVECEEQHLRKLHAVVETLVNHRKELAVHTALFAKSLAMLGSSEDNTALSRALSQLAELEERIEQLHQEQANSDFFFLAELLADYIRLLSTVRAAFDQRMKSWQRWQDGQIILQKKRENEGRLLWANKPDKLQQAKDEISEWESRVTQYERDFERVSATVRKEVMRFEKEKTKDFRNHVIKYLETLLNSQNQVFKVDVFFNGRKHSLMRRYSEFHTLHKRIKKNCKVPDFPPKRVPNWMPKVLEQRRQGLEAYIQGVLYHNQDVPKELLEFLKVKHFQHSTKNCSLDSLAELSAEENSFLLCHRPVVGFHNDPYVLPSGSDLLPELIVTGVLEGHYRPGTSTREKTGPKVPNLSSPV